MRADVQAAIDRLFTESAVRFFGIHAQRRHETLTQRTKGVSAAFIKELMRRVAQASIARDGGTAVESRDIGEAVDDMLFTGRMLNIKLRGGTGTGR